MPMSTPAENSHPSSSLRAALLALAGCFLFTFITLPRFFADSVGYSREVLVYDHDASRLPAMWDFGHLLWRWLGYLLFHAAKPFWVWLDGGENIQAYYRPLLVLSWVATCVALFLTLRLIERFDRSWSTSVIATVCYLAVNSVLNNLQSGTSYIPGLAFETAALVLLFPQVGPVPMSRAKWIGLCLALSGLMWLPYVVIFPAVLLTPFIRSDDGAESRRRNWTLAIRSIVYGTAIGAAFYILPIVSLHMYSVHQIVDWVVSSAHGISQTKRYLRFVFGFPASYFFQGNEGALFKRYLFHDPYANVTLMTLLRGSLAKIAIFFSFCAVFLFVLARRDRRWFVWVGTAMVSAIAFAIFVFEPSSIERYLPLMPFLAVGLVIACEDVKMKWLTLAFLVVLVGNNVSSHWRPSVLAEYDRVESRAQPLRSRVTSKDIEYLATANDDLYTFPIAYQYHAFNRNSALNIDPAVELNLKSTVIWRENFGRLAKQAWDQGGNVWMSRRLFSPRPDPGLRWTEGDDPHVHWADIPAFFSQFDQAESVGGDDGFVLLAKTPKNVELVQSLAAKWKLIY